MNNYELIVRNIGTSKLIFLKFLKESIGNISLPGVKNITDCFPPFNHRNIDYVNNLIDEVNISFRDKPNREDWKLYITDDNVVHFHFYIETNKQENFKKLINSIDKTDEIKTFIKPDCDFIGYKEKREDKLKDILD